MRAEDTFCPTIEYTSRYTGDLELPGTEMLNVMEPLNGFGYPSETENGTGLESFTDMGSWWTYRNAENTLNFP